MLHRTQVEAENRAAFLVQLHAVLGQVSRLLGGGNLSAAQRSRLQPVQTLVADWLNEVSAIAPPRLAVLPTPTAPAATTTAAAGGGGDAATPASSSSTASPPSASAAFAEAETSPVPAGAMEPASTIVPGRTVVELVAVGQRLLAAEVAGVRAAGKGLVRLVLVRCMSTIVAVLRHVLHQSYRPARRDFADGAVVLARDLRLSVRAVVICLETVTAQASVDDVATLRFPLQTCTDTLRQLRAAMERFRLHVEKTEAGAGQAGRGQKAAALRNDLRGEEEEREEAEEAEAAEAAEEKEVRTEEDDDDGVARYDVSERAAWLTRRWGPALTQAMALLGELVPPALEFVGRVASLPDGGSADDTAGGASAAVREARELRREAQTALFELAVCTTAAAAPFPPPAFAPGAERTPAVQTEEDAMAGREALLPRLRFSFVADYIACVATMCGDATEGQLIATRILSDTVHHLARERPAVLRCCLTQPRWRARVLEGALRCLVSLQRAVMQAGLAVLHDVVATCVDVLSEDLGYVYLYGVFRLLESENCPAAARKDILRHLLQTFLPPSIVAAAPPRATRVANALLFRLYVRYDLNRQAYQVDLVQRLIAALAHLVRRAGPAEFAPSSLAPSEKQKAETSLAAAASRMSLAGLAHYGLVCVAELLARDIAARVATATRASAAARREGGGDGAESRRGSNTTSNSSSSNNNNNNHAARRKEDEEEENEERVVEGGVDPAAIRVLHARADKTAQARLAELFNRDPHNTLVRLFRIGAEELQPAMAEHGGPSAPAAAAEGAEEEEETDAPAHEPPREKSGRGFTSTWDHRLLPAPRSAATAQKIDAIVDFLYHVSALRAEVVAEYLSSPAVLPLQVCAAYLARLPLAGCSVTEALQILLAQLPLPREGQRIERLLEYFSAAYFNANQIPGVDRVVFPFEDDATCFVAVVATVMLNTDLHNPHAGARMTQDSFLAQMRACVKSPFFTDDFAHEIFFRVQHHHLGTARPTRPASDTPTTVSSGGEEAAASAMNINSLFISGTERRLLAFGLERQRILTETRDRLRDYHVALMAHDVYHGEAEGEGGGGGGECAYGLATLRDFVLSTWPTLSAVFALPRSEASGQDTAPGAERGATQALPEEVLQGCVRGLRALLYSAAVCGLTAEAEAALRALLRLGRDDERIRGRAWAAVLRTAASAAALHFSAACWTLVFSLVHSLRRGMSRPSSSSSQRPSTTPSQLALAQSEAVLGRVEFFTQRHCTAHALDGGTGETLYGKAVTRVLDGVLDSLAATPPHDGLGIAAGLALLRRVLTYSRIVHSATTNDAADETSVGTCVNVNSLRRQVLPRLVELIAAHGASDEVVQRFMECLVDLLGLLWGSSSTRAGEEEEEVKEDTGETSRSACYAVLFECYARQPRNTMVQMLVLQAVKELMARTWHMTESAAEVSTRKSSSNNTQEGSTSERCSASAAPPPPALSEALSIWRRVLCPVVDALARRESGAETSSLAVLVLRNLTLLSCRTAQARRVPLAYRRVWWTLLSSAAYVGTLCRDLNSAQTCLTQLRTLCAEALAEEEGDMPSRSTVHDDNKDRSSTTSWSSSSNDNKNDGKAVQSVSAAAQGVQDNTADASVAGLLHGIVAGLALSGDFVTRHALRLLILLVQSEHESLRADVMEALRTLAKELRRGHFCLVAGVLARVVLQNTLETSAHHRSSSSYSNTTSSGAERRTGREEAEMQSFALFALTPSQSAPRRCSATAFRATLPLALNYLTSELLAAAAAADATSAAATSCEDGGGSDDAAAHAPHSRSSTLSSVAGLVMERCLVPLIAANAAAPGHTSSTDSLTGRARVGRVGAPAVVAQTRYLAARSLMQCGLYCLNERRRNEQLTQNATTTTTTITGNESEGGDDFPLSCMLRCVGMVLYSAQRPLHGIAPRTANFAGRRWRHGRTAAVWDEVNAYAAAAEDYLTALTRADAAAMADPMSSLPSQCPVCAPEQVTCGECDALDQDKARNEGEAEEGVTGHTNSENDDENAVGWVAEDEQLVEYTTLLAQTVSVFPRLLAAMAEVRLKESSVTSEPDSHIRTEKAHGGEGLTLPPVSRRVMRRLLLHAASNLCAMLWRIAHPYAMQDWLAHTPNTNVSVGSTSERAHTMQPVVWRRSTALLPHAAIRGLLHSYVELALGGETPESARDYCDALVELLRVVRAVQAAATRATALGIVALYEETEEEKTPNEGRTRSHAHSLGEVRADGRGYDMRAEAAVLQRLSPQEQQHVRTCFVGMYQELSVVLATWLSPAVLQSPLNAPCEVAGEGCEGGVDCGGAMRGRSGALASRAVYEAVVRLLSPVAGAVIDTAREYLLWHAAQEAVVEGDTGCAVMEGGGDEVRRDGAALHE